MKKIVFLVALLVCKTVCFGQAPDWEWAKSVGDTSFEKAFSVAVDDSGNVFTTGFFNNTVDFNPGPGIFNLSAVGSNQNVFVLKLNSSGGFVWAKALGAPSSSSIALDHSGNIYTTGYFSGIKDFNPGPSIYNLSSNTVAIYISKLNHDGNFVWAKKVAANFGSAEITSNSISVEANGNCYLTGSFYGNIDFDPGIDTFELNTTTNFFKDIFILKLDSSGNFVWANKVGTITGHDSGVDVSVDSSGNVYFCGSFYGPCDFNSSPSQVFNLNNGGSFISKLDSNGNFIWAKEISDTSIGVGIYVQSIAIDIDGNIYTTGFFSGIVDFDPSVGSFYVIGSFDMFILKLSNSGNFNWVIPIIGSTGIQHGHSIDTDNLGNIYTTGFFSGIVDFNPDSIGTHNLSGQNHDLFVYKISTNKNFIWAKSAPGTDNDEGCSIAIDNLDNTYLTGWFYSDSIVFGTTDLLNFEGVLNSTDLLIAKLSFCIPTSNTFSTSSCIKYISPSGNQLWTNSGIYSDTISNSSGCDSVVTINLTINTVDTTVIYNGDTLTSNAQGVTYQWLNCSNNFAIITGATNQTFTASTNGNYAVAITQNGCTDTSACYAITEVGINGINAANDFTIYPNPTNNQFTVYSAQLTVNSAIIITNMLGEVVYTESVNQKSKIINLKYFPAGIYFVRVQTDKGSVVKKMVKE